MKDNSAVESEFRIVMQGVVFALVCALAAELLLTAAIARGEYLGFFGRVITLASGIYAVHRLARFCLDRYQPTSRDMASIGVLQLGGYVTFLIGRFIAED